MGRLGVGLDRQLVLRTRCLSSRLPRLLLLCGCVDRRQYVRLRPLQEAEEWAQIQPGVEDVKCILSHFLPVIGGGVMEKSWLHP